MPTIYWGPWLAKINRGGPAIVCATIKVQCLEYLVYITLFYGQRICYFFIKLSLFLQEVLMTDMPLIFVIVEFRNFFKAQHFEQ